MFKKKNILVVGDIMLDKYSHGVVNRISPEAPVPIVDIKKTVFKPGGASNVAQNLSALGMNVSLLGITGDDPELKELIKVLRHTSIKFDPVKDLSNMQQILKDKVLDYDPKLWILASGNAKEIFDIKHNGINLLETETKDKEDISYKDLLLLVDKNNHLRMALRANSKSPEGEGVTRRMKQSLALLLKQYDKEKK